jgi:uncharacterized protein YbjT (DUF2867 family)
MIIVTGANGKLGRAIVEHLLELIPAERIGVSVQNPPEGTRPRTTRGSRPAGGL